MKVLDRVAECLAALWIAIVVIGCFFVFPKLLCAVVALAWYTYHRQSVKEIARLKAAVLDGYQTGLKVAEEQAYQEGWLGGYHVADQKYEKFVARMVAEHPNTDTCWER